MLSGSGTTTNAASFVWFVLIIACVILVAWALIQLGPKYVQEVT